MRTIRLGGLFLLKLPVASGPTLLVIRQAGQATFDGFYGDAPWWQVSP